MLVSIVVGSLVEVSRLVVVWWLGVGAVSIVGVAVICLLFRLSLVVAFSFYPQSGVRYLFSCSF